MTNRLSQLIAVAEQLIGTGGVLAYHDVTAEPFLEITHVTATSLRVHLEFVASRYCVIRLRELVDRRRAGRSVRGCVAITFDDAYEGLLRLAVPMLQHLNLPATVFVPTGFVRQRSPFWWDRLEWVAQRMGVDGLTRIARAVGVDDERLLREAILAGGGRLSPGTERALAAAEQAVGSTSQRPLGEQGLAKLATCDLIDFGCHTVTHPSLPLLPGDSQKREIERSHDWLASRLPRVQPFLAYPFGLYDRTSMAMARAARMEAAFSMQGRAGGPRFSLYACPRIGIAEVNTLRTVRWRLGWWAIPAAFLREGHWHPRVPAPKNHQPARAPEAQQE